MSGNEAARVLHAEPSLGHRLRKIAELLNEKKLPLVGDVRDESAEDVRLVIEPKSRSVDPELMMESLFRLTELENKIPLNLNVLIKGRVEHRSENEVKLAALEAEPFQATADFGVVKLRVDARVVLDLLVTTEGEVMTFLRVDGALLGELPVAGQA